MHLTSCIARCRASSNLEGCGCQVEVAVIFVASYAQVRMPDTGIPCPRSQRLVLLLPNYVPRQPFRLADVPFRFFCPAHHGSWSNAMQL